MRFSIAIAPAWRPLSGSSASRRRGRSSTSTSGAHPRLWHARERIAWDNVDGAAPLAWPFYYGLGPKLGPDGGVAYVGSTRGVVQVRLRRPQSLGVWAFFRKRHATCVTLSLSEPDAFLRAIAEKLAQPAM